MKRYLPLLGWFFLATQYIAPPATQDNPHPTPAPLSAVQVGPFGSETKCWSIEQSFISGAIMRYDANISWSLSQCFSGSGAVSDIAP